MVLPSRQQCDDLTSITVAGKHFLPFILLDILYDTSVSTTTHIPEELKSKSEKKFLTELIFRCDGT